MTPAFTRGLQSLSETRVWGGRAVPRVLPSLVALTVTVCNQTHAVSARPHGEGPVGGRVASAALAVSFSKMTDGGGERQAQSVPVGPFSGRGARWPQNAASPPWTCPPSLISLPVKPNPGVLP